MIRESIEISLLIKRSNWSENILWMEEKKGKKKGRTGDNSSSYLYRNNIVRWFDKGEESIFVRYISGGRIEERILSCEA